MSSQTSMLRYRTQLCLVSLLIVLLAWQVPPIFADEEAASPSRQVSPPRNVAQLREIESQVRKVIAKVLPSVVGVQIGGSRGSGVIVSEDGYVMTAGHVVNEPGLKVTFTFPDGSEAVGTTLGRYKTTDAGLMKIDDEGKWPFVEKGRSADLKPGTWCVAIGHPMGYQKERPPVVRVGRVLKSGDDVIQTDCLLVGGDSGGPLFDLEGKVIGINSRIGNSPLLNFHVPVDVYLDNWDRLADSESWERVLPGRDSDEVKAAFRDVIADAARCAVRIKCGGKDVALGTIVGPDGWILTKASELKGKIVCRLCDDREFEAQFVGVLPAFDLAMLKIELTDLPIIEFAQKDPAVGQWVASLTISESPLAIGVVSVPRRKIPPTRGYLGILLKDVPDEALIERVLPGSPAEKAGLKAGDVITHVNETRTPDREKLIDTIKNHRPGESVKLKVKRGEKELELSATLIKLNTPASQKRDRQNAFGGVSKRSDDFAVVLQHDTALKPTDCGGPLVDLTGKVVGLNIARGGRTETYTVPSDILLENMYDLISGRLTPPAIKKERERKAEEERKKAEAEKKAEEDRKKAEAEKKAEEDRKKAEAEKKAEEDRKKAEAEKKAEEDRKKAEAEKKAEEDRKKAEAEKKAEEDRKKAEAEKKAEEDRKKAEAEKKAEEDRKKAEAEKKAEEDRKKAEAEKQAPPEQDKPDQDKDADPEDEDDDEGNGDQPTPDE